MNTFLLTGGDLASRQNEIEKTISHLTSSFLFGPTNPDLFILDLPEESSIGIEQIREVTRFASIKPYSHTHKIVVINDSSRLTPQAQNALLKLLEEPPLFLLIFLASPTDQDLLPTVLSRCLHINLGQLTPTLSKEQITHFQDLINNIINEPFPAAVEICEQHSKDAKSAAEFCQSAVIALEKNLALPATSINSAKYIRIIQKSLKFLEANVNPKLTMDNLILSLRMTAKKP